MLSDYKELLSILNAHRVKYLVIGAYAVAIHAQPRATKDLDILIQADPENARAAFAALAEFGAPLQGLAPADFEEPGPFFRIGREPVGVYILTAIPGVEFDAAWPRRVEEVFDEETNWVRLLWNNGQPSWNQRFELIESVSMLTWRRVMRITPVQVP
jgi:hypothetical protein